MVITVVVVGALAVLVTAGVVAAVVAAQLRRWSSAAGAARSAAEAREAEFRDRALDRQFDAVHGELRQVGAVVADLRAERSRQHGEFLARLDDASQATGALHHTTAALREALASPKARGQWGERTADDVLRLAGLVEGVSYLRQRATAAGTIPDVTFLLPGDLLLHMDVKFPAANYLRSLEAASPAERAAAERTFLTDVRARIREVTDRGYIEAGTTVDYVLLFVPNESVYGFLHDRDPALVDFALASKVVLCSPFSLYAVLAVIRQAVDAMRLERATDDILRCLATFGAEWERFCEQLARVERAQDTLARQLEALAGTRRRRLQRQVDAARQLHDERGLPLEPLLHDDVEASDDPDPPWAVRARAG